MRRRTDAEARADAAIRLYRREKARAAKRAQPTVTALEQANTLWREWEAGAQSRFRGMRIAKRDPTYIAPRAFRQSE